MKKLLALLMALVFVFSFAACSSEDKDDDKKKDDKEATSVVSDEITPTPSTPDSSTKKAEEAVRDYLSNFEAETLVEISGEDISTYDDSQKVGLAVFDGIISNSEFVIVSSEEVDSSTVNVNITLTVPDAETGFQLLYSEIEKLAAENPDATQDEILKLVSEAALEVFADPNVKTKTSPLTLTVKLTNGKWTVEPSEEFITIIAGGFLDAAAGL